MFAKGEFKCGFDNCFKRYVRKAALGKHLEKQHMQYRQCSKGTLMAAADKTRAKDDEEKKMMMEGKTTKKAQPSTSTQKVNFTI